MRNSFKNTQKWRAYYKFGNNNTNICNNISITNIGRYIITRMFFMFYY